VTSVLKQGIRKIEEIFTCPQIPEMAVISKLRFDDGGTIMAIDGYASMRLKIECTESNGWLVVDRSPRN